METKELEQKLTELETTLKNAATAEAKKEAAEQVKAFESKHKEAIEGYTTLKASFDELTAKSDKLAADAEANQPVIDAYVKQKNERPVTTPNMSLEEIIGKAINENVDKIEKMVRKDPGRQKQFTIDLDKKAVGDVLIANYTGGTAGLVTVRPGLIAQPPRKVHVRDLLPQGAAGPGTQYVFMRENGAGEGAIASVAEGATKPQIDIDLIESAVNFEVIAGWMRVSRKAMNNIQGFVSFLQARLPEKLLRVEDGLLLNGTGTSPQIKGLQVASNFTAASGAATVDIEQLVQAISQLEELDREANGIVVRPSDYYNLLLNKSALSGDYDLPEIITVDALGTMRIMGIPVVRTAAQTVDKFLVGDFRMGAQLLIQEGIRIEFFEQDSTNVRENMITVRIEETIAFPVFGSDYFIYGDFGNV